MLAAEISISVPKSLEARHDLLGSVVVVLLHGEASPEMRTMHFESMRGIALKFENHGS
jgi:hypothetical protein